MNNQIDFVLPVLYDKFLSEMGEDGEFNLEDSGITLYSKTVTWLSLLKKILMIPFTRMIWEPWVLSKWK